MREIIIASHEKLALGMKQTLEFLIGKQNNIHALCAYTDNLPIEDEVNRLMEQYSGSEQVIIFTDLLAGSVNQKFSLFRQKANVKVITGMNLPLIMGIAMLPENQIISDTQIEKLIQDSQEQIVFMNKWQPDMSEEDE